MNRFYIVSIFIVISGCGFSREYTGMKDAYDKHTTPHYYEESIKPPVLSVEREKVNGDRAIKGSNLEKEKERWLDIIKTDSIGSQFYDLDKDEIKKIRARVKDGIEDTLLEGEITLDTLIAFAVEKNPGLAASKKGWEAILERYSQADRLDNILRQYQASTKSINLMTGEELQKGSIKDNFPFPGMLTLKGDIVAKEAEMAREEYLIVLRDMIVRLNKAYDELVFINTAIGFTNENLQILKRLESVTASKYSTGKGVFSDVLNTQIEITRLSNELITLKEEKGNISAEINRELSRRPSDKPLGEPKRIERHTMLPRLEDLYETAMKYNQEIRLLDLKIEAANLTILLAEKGLYPDFSKGFSYFENDSAVRAGSLREEETFESKPMGMPNFWFGAEDSYLREAKLSYQKMYHDKDNLKNEIFFNIKEMHFNVDKDIREITLYKDSLIPQAEKSFHAIHSEYEAGKADFIDLLNSLKRLLEFNLDYHRALKEYDQNFCHLEGIIGKRDYNHQILY